MIQAHIAANQIIARRKVVARSYAAQIQWLKLVGVIGAASLFVILWAGLLICPALGG